MRKTIRYKWAALAAAGMLLWCTAVWPAEAVRAEDAGPVPEAALEAEPEVAGEAESAEAEEPTEQPEQLADEVVPGEAASEVPDAAGGAVKPARPSYRFACAVDGTTTYGVWVDGAMSALKFYVDSSGYFRVQDLEGVQYESMDPAVLEIDASGNITLKSVGSTSIRVTIPEDELYGETVSYVPVTVQKHSQFFYFSKYSVRATMSEGGYQLVPLSHEGLRYPVTYATSDPAVCTVSETGYITYTGAGTATVTASVPEDDLYKAYEAEFRVYLTADEQEITGERDVTVRYGQDIALNLQAMTELLYISVDPELASVTEDGVVSFRHPGTAMIRVIAPATTMYCAKYVLAYVTSELETPDLNVVSSSGRNKLTWSRVSGAAGYEVYVRYPGRSDFRKVLTKSAEVKSVTHRGVTEGKYYEYKVRAFIKISGKYYYSPFSETFGVTAI